MYRIALFVAVLAAQPAFGADAVTKLECATAREYNTQAERELISTDTYSLNVIFLGATPPAKEIDGYLRECLAAAITRDGTRDIVVSPWLRRRVHDRHSNDELLHPYGGLRYLAYEARSRTIAIRDSK